MVDSDGDYQNGLTTFPRHRQPPGWLNQLNLSIWWWRPILKSWYETKLLLTKSRTRAARTHRSEGGRRRRRSERLYITSAYRAHDNDQEIDSLAKSKMLTQRARFIIMHMAFDMAFLLGGVRIYRGKWGRGR